MFILLLWRMVVHQWSAWRKIRYRARHSRCSCSDRTDAVCDRRQNAVPSEPVSILSSDIATHMSARYACHALLFGCLAWYKPVALMKLLRLSSSQHRLRQVVGELITSRARRVALFIRIVLPDADVTAVRLYDVIQLDLVLSVLLSSSAAVSRTR